MGGFHSLVVLILMMMFVVIELFDRHGVPYLDDFPFPDTAQVTKLDYHQICGHYSVGTR